MTQLPILQVLIPLLGAPLCALLRQRRVAWLLFVAAASGALVCALLLARRVLQGEVLRYSLGGWPAPTGIEYVIDPVNAPMLALVSTVALIVAVYARASVELEIEPHLIPLFYACMCLCLAGMLGVTATGDAFNTFVFLEITSLSSYALIAMGRRRRALLAAFRYLIIGTIGATFLLIGIGLAYAVTGTLNMADLAQRLPDVYGNRALTAAVAFVVVGLSVKMAVFPLHSWLPGAYGEAPSAVSTLLAGVSTKVALYAFLRFTLTVFGGSLVFGLLPVGVVGLVVASAAMLVASAVACFQRDLKYVLGWSSIAQVGYIIAGFSLATSAGVAAGYLHLINHAVTKAALFAAAGVLLMRLGSVQLSALTGQFRRMPWTFAAIVLAGVGLVGLPPTAGFASKWALVLALQERGQWFVLAAVLVSSLLSVVYVGRIVEIGWFREPVENPPLRKPAPSMIAMTWLLVLMSLYFGLSPVLPATFADGAAAALLGGAP
jgi:multicomponent Na+:H+ antiporter subunit D